MDTRLINHAAAAQECFGQDNDRQNMAAILRRSWLRLMGVFSEPGSNSKSILDSNPRRSERAEIVDWGCGYGRVSLYFLELGFDVIGIGLSEKAIALAREAYKQRQSSGIPLFGSASFHAGDMCSVCKSRVGQKVGAFFSNRVLHLLAEAADFCEAALLLRS
jgi:SAM-dependent methyltransferase